MKKTGKAIEKTLDCLLVAVVAGMAVFACLVFERMVEMAALRGGPETGYVALAAGIMLAAGVTLAVLVRAFLGLAFRTLFPGTERRDHRPTFLERHRNE